MAGLLLEYVNTQRVKGYWSKKGIEERDTKQDLLKASHYFIRVAELTRDPIEQKNARLATGFLFGNVRLEKISQPLPVKGNVDTGARGEAPFAWSPEGALHMWNAQTFAWDTVWPLTWHGVQRKVRFDGATVSPNHERAVTWDERGSVQIWDIKSQQLVREANLQARLGEGVAIRRGEYVDKIHLVLLLVDRLALWDTEADSWLLSPVLAGGVQSIVLSYDKQRVLTLTVDGTVRVWKTRTLQP